MWLCERCTSLEIQQKQEWSEALSFLEGEKNTSLWAQGFEYERFVAVHNSFVPKLDVSCAEV